MQTRNRAEMISRLCQSPIQLETDPSKVEHIPCLFIPFKEGTNKLILFFHANAEDIGGTFDFLYLMVQKL